MQGLLLWPQGLVRMLCNYTYREAGGGNDEISDYVYITAKYPACMYACIWNKMAEAYLICSAVNQQVVWWSYEVLRCRFV